MWFIGVEVEQETGEPPPKKHPESAPGFPLVLFCFIHNSYKTECQHRLLVCHLFTRASFIV